MRKIQYIRDRLAVGENIQRQGIKLDEESYYKQFSKVTYERRK
jgi:hypothetical protein